ncbi:GmrSD restriction endonuclease domain-containing protein [Sphingomonas sp. Mn802worker]|uniref:GmrSD restriction endonuclease domain-containing protein n=1 Tax=Sphingomonas sp. Mn802worker TaxID=629773 RepID=UPI00039AA033|nr:DUF262 domain-containing protein [Sphingomonas sp. Mn802worker]
MTDSTDWFDDYAEENVDGQIDEYDVTATPNDFNVLTLYSFIEAGAVRIPGFQRNYVWDKVRASRLIESLILGIPVPQLFLYEQARNRFQVIDGQQRLMSVYYYLKRRFPRIDKRGELRAIFDENGGIPDRIIHNDEYFEDFNLKLSGALPNQQSKFHGLNYHTLDDYKTQLDLRPIRNIIVKQNTPVGDDTAIYEVFNRLNTGGVNLRPQEIRTSMYHSPFYDTLYKLNIHPLWRELLQSSKPDLHMKDIEILLRGFAMLLRNKAYAPSMVRFLNQYSKMAESQTSIQNSYLADLFEGFLKATEKLPRDIFVNIKNGRFNIALYEAVFTALLEKAVAEKRQPKGKASMKEIKELSTNSKFNAAALEGTTRTSNVTTRLDTARSILTSL